MTEIMLFLVIVALLVFLAWVEIHNARERRHLINRIVAKNSNEVRLLDQAVPHPEPIERVPAHVPSTDEDSFWADLDGFTGQTGL